LKEACGEARVNDDLPGQACSKKSIGRTDDTVRSARAAGSQSRVVGKPAHKIG